MLLSLADLCLISVRNGVENKSIRHPQILPPRLRQSMLDMVMMHGGINDPDCSAVVSSVEFLSGFVSLNTQSGNKDDRLYLDSAVRSLASISAAVRTEDVITTLKLNCYGRYTFKGGARFEPTSLPNVVRLISQCPRLKTLNIRVLECSEFDDYPRGSDQGIPAATLLNRSELLEPCLSVMQNLEKLELVGCGDASVFLTLDRPMIEFEQLSSLTLVNCRVEAEAWSGFLFSIRHALIRLRLDDVLVPDYSEDTAWMLPFPLPCLGSLKIDNSRSLHRYRWDRSLTDNLLQCPSLEYACLALSEQSNDDEALSRLADLKGVLDVKVRIMSRDRHGTDEDQYLDSAASNFRLVRAFHHKVKTFELSLRHWNPGLTTALEHAVDTCQNLEEFRFDTEFIPRDRELRSAKSVLLRLFGDRSRASKIRKLSLTGEFDQEILAAAFENCVNLDSVKICNCHQLLDTHLLEWASHGGALRTVVILNAINVSDEGLIPVLVNSGKKLVSFTFSSSNPARSDVSERTWRVFLQHCPYVEYVKGIPDSLEGEIRLKCHKNLRKIGTRTYSQY